MRSQEQMIRDLRQHPVIHCARLWGVSDHKAYALADQLIGTGRKRRGYTPNQVAKLGKIPVWPETISISALKFHDIPVELEICETEYGQVAWVSKKAKEKFLEENLEGGGNERWNKSPDYLR